MPPAHLLPDRLVAVLALVGVATPADPEYARIVRAAIGTARYWVPLVAGFVCLIAAVFVSAIVAWLLIILAFGLLLDGTTAMWERAGSTGNLTTYRQ